MVILAKAGLEDLSQIRRLDERVEEYGSPFSFLHRNGKWYIGRSDNPESRIKRHFKNYASAWTRLHKPLEVEQILTNCDRYDEDKKRPGECKDCLY